MKIAFIVPRYGTEILGGPEYHCRLIAERLAERHQVDVVTTCARDQATWRNEYPEGPDRIRGVTVRRFPNARTRDLETFTRYTEWICSNSHTADDELEWLRQQGPWCPSLVEYLQAHHATYDALVFFTYRHAPTVLGLRVAPARSILVPTAHDEPAIRLEIFKEVFSRPAGIAYNTASERRFLARLFSIPVLAEDTIGCGVDLPQHHAYPRHAPPAIEVAAGVDETPAEGEDRRPGADQIAPHRARRDVPPPPPAARAVRPVRRPHRGRKRLRGAG